MAVRLEKKSGGGDERKETTRYDDVDHVIERFTTKTQRVNKLWEFPNQWRVYFDSCGSQQYTEIYKNHNS